MSRVNVEDKEELTVALGESLTILSLIHKGALKPQVIIDIWEGGTTLYGWDTYVGICIDRLPMISDKPCLHNLKFIKLEPEVEDIGHEEGFNDKVLKHLPNVQINWLSRLTLKGYVPRKGWCNLIRSLRESIHISRLYGEIKYILLDEHIVRVGWRTGIRYGEIVSSMPVPYVLSKIITSNTELKKLINDSVFEYASLYIVTLIIRNYGIRNVKVIRVGKKGFLTALVYLIPSSEIYELNNDSLIVYIMAPITLATLKPEIGSKLISEAKKLGVRIDMKSIIMYRDYFEKYAFLGAMNESATKVVNVLSSVYNFRFKGRLGLWREVSICDLINV